MLLIAHIMSRHALLNSESHRSLPSLSLQDSQVSTVPLFNKTTWIRWHFKEDAQRVTLMKRREGSMRSGTSEGGRQFAIWLSLT